MEDTEHYHFSLLKYLLDRRYMVALIPPTTTDLTRKLQDDITQNAPLDSLTICYVIGSNQRKKPYRITKASQIINFADVAPYHYESSQFTAQHTAITKKGHQCTQGHCIRNHLRIIYHLLNI